MILAFELTMPHCGSWNGHWSQEQNRHIITYATPRYDQKRMKELDGKNFFYRWPDGWEAMISCRCVTAKEAKKLRDMSCGFCGYDWMVRSIWNYGEILNSSEQERRAALEN